MKSIVNYLSVLLSVMFVSIVYAEPDTRVIVTIENLAPSNGTFQTPFWVGFHDGATFDTYDGGTFANTKPIAGSEAIERLSEDGNTAPISADFDTLVPDGAQGTIPGPNGPIAPGDIAQDTFLLDSNSPNHRYFSYASMVIPSNDFWVSNGNPVAHPIFDADGNVVAEDFIITNRGILDAGTEVNDEIPENTAFFGQQAPNTGVDEGEVIRDFPNFPGFMPPGSGGILDDPMFAMANFRLEGYPLAKVSFKSIPAVVDDLFFAAELSGDQEVPPVDENIRPRAKGWAFYQLRDEGTRLKFKHAFVRLGRVLSAHLHLAPAGENGPIVAFLLPADLSDLTRDERRALRKGFDGELTSADLTGPLAGLPLDALINEILDGNIYINVHTKKVPSGEARGQLMLE